MSNHRNKIIQIQLEQEKWFLQPPRQNLDKGIKMGTSKSEINWVLFQRKMSSKIATKSASLKISRKPHRKEWVRILQVCSSRIITDHSQGNRRYNKNKNHKKHPRRMRTMISITSIMSDQNIQYVFLFLCEIFLCFKTFELFLWFLGECN